MNGPQKMQNVLDRNDEVSQSVLRALQELAILRDNLIHKEVGGVIFLFSSNC